VRYILRTPSFPGMVETKGVFSKEKMNIKMAFSKANQTKSSLSEKNLLIVVDVLVHAKDIEINQPRIHRG
jgi:hypothetical protein